MITTQRRQCEWLGILSNVLLLFVTQIVKNTRLKPAFKNPFIDNVHFLYEGDTHREMNGGRKISNQQINDKFLFDNACNEMGLTSKRYNVRVKSETIFSSADIHT